MARNNTPVDKNSREYLLRQVANGRYSLLLIVILTVVNLIMTILDTNTYFLFSASVPYYLVFVGMGIENGFVDGAWNVKGTAGMPLSGSCRVWSSRWSLWRCICCAGC